MGGGGTTEWGPLPRQCVSLGLIPAWSTEICSFQLMVVSSDSDFGNADNLKLP